MCDSATHSHGEHIQLHKAQSCIYRFKPQERKKHPFPLIKHLNLDIYKFWNDLFPFRLSSIDMKYHVWKLGVVFTDNVSMASGKVKSYAPKSRDVIRCHKETSYGGGPGRCREFSWKTDSLRVWGDTSLSCNSIRPRGGFTWQFLGQFTAQDEKKWVSWMPEKLLNFFHSPVLSLPRLVHDHVSPGPLQQLFLRCSSSGYRNGLQDSEDYSVICHSQWQTGMGVYTGAEWEGPRYG